MKDEKKIPLAEVHKRLNAHRGEVVSAEDFESLFWCWKRHAHKPTAGKEGWLKESLIPDFLEYSHWTKPIIL